MVGTSTSWKVITNHVRDRMIDGSLSHMFTTRRRIRKRTQILNRELRQLSSIRSYEKYVKIKKAVLRVVPDADDTDEDYFSNNDFEETHKFRESTGHYKNYDDEEICNEYSDDDEMEPREIEDVKVKESREAEDDKEIESPGTKDDKEVLEQSTNELVEGGSNSDREDETVDQCFVSQSECSPMREDIKRNLSEDFESLSNDYIDDNATAPGDSGIDEDSLDSLVANAIDAKKPNRIIEKSNDPTLASPEKSHPKIMCTEIVTAKYKILCGNEDEQTDRNTTEKLLDNSVDETTDNCCETMSLSNDEASEREVSKRKSTSLTVPSEIDSLKYILNNLRIHNRYADDFYMNTYSNNATKANEPDLNETAPAESSRPMNLDEFIENDDLIELDADSTLTLEDITEDDEIFLIEIPKLIIDNQDLKGKRMKIKKSSVLIGDTKYKAYRKQNEELTCILKEDENDTDYKIETIKPRASIVIRQEPSQSDSLSLMSHLSHDKNQYAPFPKNLKRRNPLVLESDCNDDYLKRENDKVVNHMLSPKRKVGKSI